ncbi:hypothetical protein Tco_0939862 [Tanacetum coccineum]|uniref:Uncharacterized protein n=1 Tax=Tanacetum coccineum TaxID=301880 RepID=A0ABQ5DM52_9ASTR
MANSWKGKDWTKVVLTDEIMEYYSIAILLFEIEEVIVVSSSDENLSTDEEIVLMGDVSFSDDDDRRTTTNCFNLCVSMLQMWDLQAQRGSPDYEVQVSEMKSSQVKLEMKWKGVCLLEPLFVRSDRCKILGLEC